MKTSDASSEKKHPWRFTRLGGFDQVRLDSVEDLLALEALDQKLWAVLSCPTRGVEFPARTLELMDTDGDGHIHVPEILTAVKWTLGLLKEPGVLLEEGQDLPLSAIDDEQGSGQKILASARKVLGRLGKPRAETIALEDLTAYENILAEDRIEANRVLVPGALENLALRRAVEDIVRCLGGVEDPLGVPGVSLQGLNTFYQEAADYQEWWSEAEADPEGILPLGPQTGEGAAALEAVRNKVEDYFTRCRVAGYDVRAVDALSPSPGQFEELARTPLSWEPPELAAFPLARIEAEKPLPLKEGLNPAWARAMERLYHLVVMPLLGPKESLGSGDWANLTTAFSAYQAWLARQKGSLVAPLGIDRIRDLLRNDSHQALAAILQRLFPHPVSPPDEKVDQDLERLVRMRRDLLSLLNNFVSFREFYTGRRAIFQVGTLYLDQRSCELCVNVDDMEGHQALASLSGTFLAYCHCTRRRGTDQMTIAAAFTNGDSENLRVGRNGLFYDRRRNDWDATIVKLVEHPISVRQAFWSPYKRMGRIIGGQIEKMAAERDKAVEERAAREIAVTGQPSKETTKAQAFDIAKFAGIFAAIGLALGAMGTAAASVFTELLSLHWWQVLMVPLVILIAISGPSMVLAYMKLRRRNLGPLLDASGWAVNIRARINIVFGAKLTGTAALPAGAERLLADPHGRTGWFRRKKKA